MIFSDTDLTNIKNVICPQIQEEQIQPASIDLKLNNELKKLNGETYNLSDGDYTLKPSEFILGSTLEEIYIPLDLVGIVNGKSSLARLGIQIHMTAGYIDPGYRGNITLEILNVSNKPFKLTNEMFICQLILETLTNPATRPYGNKELNSHYQNSKGTVLSKYNGDIL